MNEVFIIRMFPILLSEIEVRVCVFQCVCVCVSVCMCVCFFSSRSLSIIALVEYTDISVLHLISVDESPTTINALISERTYAI